MAKTATLHTNHGDIVVNLFENQAPKTVENFVGLATGTKEYADPKTGQQTTGNFYDGLTFHRVIDGFMIQGGGFTPEMNQKPTRAPIENEAKNGLKNTVGTLAMARTNDPHSATAQFFINLVDNAPLNYPSRDGWGYAVFGKVTQGLDVVQKIAKVQTGNKGYFQDVPLQPVVIQSVKVLPAVADAPPAKK